MAIHALAALGVLYWPVAWSAKTGLLFVVGAHAYLRRPSPPEIIVRNRNGLWALPDAWQTALRLSRTSRFGAWWAELHLAGSDRTHRRLLCRDQVAARDWRRLQLALRQPANSADLS